MNPPQVLFPGSFDTTVKVTLAAYLHKMKFEKQVLDRCGPAQVGFDRNSGLSVYCEKAFTPPRLSSRALRLTHDSGYEWLQPQD